MRAHSHKARIACFWDPKNRPHVGHDCQALVLTRFNALSWNQRGLGLETTSSWCGHGFGGNLSVTCVFAKFQQELTFYHSLGFWFNDQILILVPTTRNLGTSLFTMGKEYKTFLDVPGSFFLHGWQWFFFSWAVPGGLWGYESGHVYGAPTIVFKPYRALHIFTHRTSLQASMSNLRRESEFEFHCHMRNHGPDTVPRWCCLVRLAVLRRHWTQQLQKRRLRFARNHALHPWTLSKCVDACSRSSRLMAYDYECAKELSATLFLESQKQAFLTSWLWALTVCVCL